jgi:hypothetical protein
MLHITIICLLLHLITYDYKYFRLNFLQSQKLFALQCNRYYSKEVVSGCDHLLKMLGMLINA